MPRYRATPGKPLQLRDFDPGETGPYCDKTEARADLKALKKKIAELARMLNAEGRRAMLIVLQGMDASGKDGAVRHVFTGVNPQICRVTAFAEPDAEERKHDYLWRIHRAMPAMGQLGVFNRSHYEDVLVTRAHGKLSEAETLVRLRQIADME